MCINFEDNGCREVLCSVVIRFKNMFNKLKFQSTEYVDAT